MVTASIEVMELDSGVPGSNPALVRVFTKENFSSYNPELYCPACHLRAIFPTSGGLYVSTNAFPY